MWWSRTSKHLADVLAADVPQNMNKIQLGVVSRCHGNENKPQNYKHETKVIKCRLIKRQPTRLYYWSINYTWAAEVSLKRTLAVCSEAPVNDLPRTHVMVSVSVFSSRLSWNSLLVNFFRCSVGTPLCELVCVSPTAEAEHCCLFSASLEDSEDQAKLIVGVVAGLLIAAAVVGLIYWLYMKNTRYRNPSLCTFCILHVKTLLKSWWYCSC